MAKEILNFVCVYWEGNFRGRDYCPTDVIRLNLALQKLHPANEITLHCLTNSQSDLPYVVKIPLLYPDKLPGWWAKLEIFRSNLFSNQGDILYIDLDVTPIKSLIPLFEYKFRRTIVFMPQKWPHKGTGVINKFQSSIFRFDSDYADMFYNDVIDKVIKNNLTKKYRGDQDFLGVEVSDAETFPPEWFEKLKTCFKTPPRKDTKAILGNPKTIWRKAQKETPWIREVYQ